MARKSRKASIQAVLGGAPLLVSESAAMRTAIWNTAGYARLSIMETRDRKDSEALSNQKDLLCGYIGQKQDLKLCGLYADNGETGTNFDRSDFQRLMADIQAGKINCIVVKDLSRFGRNYVEAGNYLERVFPFLGVRFISISDGYDSTAANAGDMLAIALKNLVNEAYSMDIIEILTRPARGRRRRMPARSMKLIPWTSPGSREVYCWKSRSGESLSGLLPPTAICETQRTLIKLLLTRRQLPLSERYSAGEQTVKKCVRLCAGLILKISRLPVHTAIRKVFVWIKDTLMGKQNHGCRGL